MKSTTLRHDSAENRYQLLEGDVVVCFADYRLRGNAVELLHTEVVAGHEGKGHGSDLARKLLDTLTADGRQILPLCSFMAEYVRRHPEYAGLVAQER